MNGLKLNQKILVDSSCYFKDEILKLEKTKIADAEKTSSGIVIRMTDEGNNWGACPTRRMKDVVATAEDIEKIFNSHVLPMIERKNLNIGQGKGNCLLFVENSVHKSGGHIVITFFPFSSEKETMKEGSYSEYVSYAGWRTRTIKVFGGKLDSNVFDSTEDAKEFFSKLVKAYL